GPSLGHGAAEGNMNESYRYIQCPLQVAAEKVSHGRKSAGTLRRAFQPPGLDRLGRGGGYDFRHGEQSDVRMRCLGDVPGSVLCEGQRPFHVGFTGAYPDIADHDVAHSHFAFATLQDNGVGATGLERRQCDAPAFVRVRKNGLVELWSVWT